MSDELYEDSEALGAQDADAEEAADVTEPIGESEPIEEPDPAEKPDTEIQVDEQLTQLTIEEEPAEEDIAKVMAGLDSEEPEEVALEATGEPAAEGAAAAAAERAEPAAELEPLAATDASTAAPAWPFIVYGALWAVFAGLLAWVLLGLPKDLPTYESDLYPLFLFGGIALTATGPFLIVAVWLAIKGSVADRSGAFISSLYRGAIATMGGVALWWIVLLAVDQVRLGRLF